MLKNTSYPEYSFTCESGVMSMDFHPQVSKFICKYKKKKNRKWPNFRYMQERCTQFSWSKFFITNVTPIISVK